MPDPFRPSRRRFLALTTGFAGLAGCASLDGLGEIGGTTEGPGKATILLPLTGEQAQLGKRLEAAVRLGGGPGIGIEIRDSGSSPDTAVIAAKAAEAAGANILIGPVFSAQTKTVAAAVNIPIVTLSNDTTLADRDTFVFGVTPAQSARAVFALAAQRNIREIALVAPPGPLGARSAAEAVPIAQALGITLRPPVITDTPGTVLAELQAGGGLPDGVYLPSAGASLIPFAEALAGQDTRILGSTQWAARDLEAVRALRGAWFAAPDPLRFAAFTRAYEEQTGEPAGIISGLAYDGAELMRILGQTGKQTRRGLTRKESFTGVLGPYRFLSSGLVERGLAVLEVGAGDINLIGSTSI
ncbi:ABC transporter substrate-binding protein [Marinovum algicola]|uniref:ABC transporter substrate-binding protein n=1 Tax=Marinovum algicola TaxID=42444 RepID=UPI0024BA7C94|nr:ABC transporter substrate-binding protein [Marinovum algicola]